MLPSCENTQALTPCEKAQSRNDNLELTDGASSLSHSTTSSIQVALELSASREHTATRCPSREKHAPRTSLHAECGSGFVSQECSPFWRRQRISCTTSVADDGAAARALFLEKRTRKAAPSSDTNAAKTSQLSGRDTFGC
eukprot:2911700-Rhodomonas_salina.1